MIFLLNSSYKTLDLYNPFISLELIVWSIFIGIVIGAAASIYNKRVVGAFVRNLLAAGADSPENALTVEQLGYNKNRLILMALRNGSTLRKIVKSADVPGGISKEKHSFIDKLCRFFTGDYPLPKVNFTSARFYIPEELSYHAEVRYEKKGTDVFSLLLTILAFLVVVFLSLKIVPQLIGMADDFITGILNKNETLSLFINTTAAI